MSFLGGLGTGKVGSFFVMALVRKKNLGVFL